MKTNKKLTYGLDGVERCLKYNYNYNYYCDCNYIIKIKEVIYK
ncbi:MAG: hypothetical protein ACTSWR_07875 [Candidatus Helarchaeota archaeon]